ncbi:MAG: sigma 54-interacting transcriptional regulator [Alphaproteobacteria bacterium]|nr:sigma 54-interacting transcriptional regulator [Alphaproteobacteria bacterium]MCB9698296.1 sigma 54-interacting transcriptional regulator [Alphaproteobacteria bacterium]
MAFFRCEHLIRKTRKDTALRKVLSTIGRAPGNDVVLDDPAVQPTHANVVRQGGTHTLSVVPRDADLYVNGRRVRTATLAEGDKVLIGGWQLTWSEKELEAESSDKGSGALPLDTLEALVALSTDMLADTSPERLFAAMLQKLVELTRAEKGFVIVMQDGDRHLAASHNTGEQRLDITRVSDSIVNQVVEHLQPLIVSDATTDSRFARAKSVVDLRLSSVMCVPLVYRRDLLGVIYLGNDSITDLFTERDLALLKIYAAQASLVVFHALQLNQLRVDNRNLRSQLQAASQGEMIGTCAPMKQVFKVLRRVAPTDLSVLILGETGTGKELVAREVHRLSSRRDKSFVAINCGAIPENLLESELFGHRRGSFTGAVTDKVGKVEAANGGTLFLDEIGEMPMNLQVKLLRVLQERVIERVGDLEPRPVDIRVVAATNKDLSEMISGGSFREDLFYRLNEIAVNLPPLREREEDIAVLAQYFLNSYREQYGSKPRGFTNQALLSMKGHYWPGNVRELENRVKKAVIMSDRALLNPDDLGLQEGQKRDIKPLSEAEEEFKVEYIRKVLDLNNWNKAQTARDLGIDARTVFRYIERFKELDAT